MSNIIQKKVAVGIITNSQGEFLLQKKDSGHKIVPLYWTFFGGGVEDGESPEEAFRREIQEELSVKLEDIVLFKTYNFKKEVEADNSDIEKIFFIFSARFNGTNREIRLGEGAGFAFFTAEELSTLKMPEHVRTMLLDFLGREQNFKPSQNQ